MSSRRLFVLTAAIAAVIALGSCAGKAPPLPPRPPPAAPGETELTLFLIGDAGEPRPGGESVLLDGEIVLP